MSIGVTLLVIVGLIIGIWVFIELKRAKHKIFAILLIVLILFLYLSMSLVFKGKEINFKSADGLKGAAQIYFSWLGSFFSNLKSITSNVIRMNWKGNLTG